MNELWFGWCACCVYNMLYLLQSKLDTVGAVCIDTNGLIEAGVFNGGISQEE